MKPIALRDSHRSRPLPSDHAPGGWVVVSPDHSYHKLDAVAGWVYSHADGSRDIAALTAGLRADVDANADAALVFEALDRLADAGLLQQRSAPPAALSRRVLLQRLVGGAALTALTAALTHAQTAQAATEGMCGAEKDLIDEIAYLQTTEGEVADALDAYVEKVDDDPKADEYFLKALIRQDEVVKARERDYADKLEDATLDLAECKAGPSDKHAKKALEQRATHYQQRRQEAQTKEQLAKQAYKVRVDDISDKESSHKAKIAASQQPEELQKELIAASLVRNERRHKAMTYRVKEESGQKEIRSLKIDENVAKKAQQIKQQMVDAAERSELLAEAYTLRAREEAEKKENSSVIQKRVDEAVAQAQIEAKKLRAAEVSSKYSEKETQQKDYNL